AVAFDALLLAGGRVGALGRGQGFARNLGEDGGGVGRGDEVGRFFPPGRRGRTQRGGLVVRRARLRVGRGARRRGGRGHTGPARARGGRRRGGAAGRGGRAGGGVGGGARGAARGRAGAHWPGPGSGWAAAGKSALPRRATSPGRSPGNIASVRSPDRLVGGWLRHFNAPRHPKVTSRLQVSPEWASGGGPRPREPRAGWGARKSVV